eukprot:CAMPEP_0197668954 /NCGR_PEP_ID=MMETSP1338-20131121/70693_1 /TAXON_ID=43686 ORGANISM="Pelagodinium beii, Strain RCC1491" /NCGR_SAMPLE_ID=MMETSP1338 /ASSEMBLY_ACC=CAM_ASM_000754 /LENGTH=242 /DNA_ID=CAMNT_0043248419 /DNA_START=129 /DNA_END=853 /DNA_ORIENTATION=-
MVVLQLLENVRRFISAVDDGVFTIGLMAGATEALQKLPTLAVETSTFSALEVPVTSNNVMIDLKRLDFSLGMASLPVMTISLSERLKLKANEDGILQMNVVFLHAAALVGAVSTFLETRFGMDSKLEVAITSESKVEEQPLGIGAHATVPFDLTKLPLAKAGVDALTNVTAVTDALVSGLRHMHADGECMIHYERLYVSGHLRDLVVMGLWLAGFMTVLFAFSLPILQRGCQHHRENTAKLR